MTVIKCYLILTMGLLTSLAQGEPLVDISVQVDFGKDVGQNFGTLFEGHDASGRLAFGAGFASVYNSYYRGERNKLQFFIRPLEEEREFQIDSFPRPEGKIPSTYVYDLGENLFVHYKTKPDGLLKYDESSRSWAQARDDQRPENSAAIVRGKRLDTEGVNVTFDGKVIFKSPENPLYRYYYYGNGHLFFYRETKPTEGEVQKAVIAIPWTPYDDPIEADIAKEKVLDIFMPPEFPYAYGQLGGEVMTCSNWGGLYAFDGENWKILRKPVENVSYQVYTMISYGDRLLMGQYPSGYFFEYDGKEVRELGGWPPVAAAASPSARELQTAMIYRGELYAGVWPWAELWRLDPDSNEWDSLGRLFKYPEVHSRTVHPNEEAAIEAGLVLNQLGQRLTSMVPYKDGLVMGTSWKGGETPLDPAQIKQLSPEQLDEFGALHSLKMPGNLEGFVEWKDEVITLRFLVEDGEMKILQDGKVIASAKTRAGISGEFPQARIEWGQGVFGPIQGRILKKGD